MNTRYEQISQLGQGGQGAVSLVRDHGRGGVEVALKRVPTGMDAQALRREFAVLSALRHPSLARAYDFGCDGDFCYFTSEYVDGSDLLTWARKAPLPVVVRGLASVLRALQLLHSRGLVHGDVSPANVLVPRREGAVPKLLDLGSARAPGEAAFAVTAGYAAPELYTGRGLLYASDLYSFGALLCQCLLGVPAFGVGDASTITDRQLRGELSLPPAETSALARLCRDLLCMDPAARPRSASEVVSRLSDATEIELGVHLRDMRGAELPDPLLCGRDEQLEILLRSMAHLEEPNSPRVLCLRGALGSGRTALLSHLVRHAQLDGLAIVGAPGVPSSAQDLIRGLLGLPARPALAGFARERLETADHEDKSIEGLALAAVEVLWAASLEQPVMLVFDDLDQSCPALRTIAATVARALDSDRLDDRPRAIVAASWSSSSDFDLPHGRLIHVPPLGRLAADNAVRSMLPGIDVEPCLLDAAWTLSGGAPAQIVAFVRAVAEQGGDFARLSEGLFEALPAEERSAFAAVSAVKQPLAASMVREALGTSMTDALLYRGLLVETPTNEGLFLRASGAAISMEGCDEASRAAAVRLSEALERQGERGCAGRLRVFAGQRAAAVSLFVEAAKEAEAAGDAMASASWFDSALELVDESVAKWANLAVEIYRRVGRYADALPLVGRMALTEEERGFVHVELLLDSGRHKEALAAADKALAMGKGSLLSLEAARAAALVHLGRHEEALGAAAAALSEAPRNSSDASVGRLALVASLSCLALGRWDQASKHLSLASRAFEERADILGQLKTVAARGQLAWRQGAFDQARAAFDRAVRLAEELEDFGRKAQYLSSRASMAQLQDDYISAMADYRAALDTATLLGNEALRAGIEANLADLLVELGQFREAERLATLAMERSRATGQIRCEHQALLIRGKSRLWAGDLVRAEAALSEAKRRFAEAGEEDFAIVAELRLAEVDLSKGNAEAAFRRSGRARERARQRGFRKERARALALEARAALAFGMSAEQVLELFEEALADAQGEDERWRLLWHMSKALEFAGHKGQAINAKSEARKGLSHMLGRVPEALRGTFLSYGEALEIEPGGQEERVVSTTDRWARDLEMLMEINRELTREHDPKRLLHVIMERAVEITGAERGMVILPRAGKLEPVVAHQIAEEVEVNFSRSVAEKVVAEGRATLAVDALDDDRFRSFASVNAMKLRSILAVPLGIRKQIVGVIYLDNRLRSGVFGEADRRLLEAFGAQAAVSLETARLISEGKRRLEELERANAEVLSLSRQLEAKLERKDSDLRRVGALLKQGRLSDSGEVIGQSPAMQALRRLIERVAVADVSVYIYGPSGTGKELVARAIHACSERSSEPFVAVNCGALPDKLLSSELFGHVKGAFTGAMSDRKGLFELAHGGVLLLDEVGDMGAEMQTHLLRVLQEGKFCRLGSNEELSVNVRILCASNKDLQDEVEAGRFRQDLFYRLNVVRLDVPPLRERQDDIPLLVEHFVRKHASRAAPKEIHRRAMDLLLAGDWPGNVRELENEVRRAIAMSSEGQPILPEDLSLRLRGHGAQVAAVSLGKGYLKDRVDAFEKVVIERTLEECKGNATQAAKDLGLSRAGLYKKLGKHRMKG
jgi:transcriptional regulator with GAF, ATPase, and Fis domain/tetratricopeptide (TPR) repeat protein